MPTTEIDFLTSGWLNPVKKLLKQQFKNIWNLH